MLRRFWPKPFSEALTHPTVAGFTDFQLGLYIRIAVLLSQHKALGRWPAIEGAEWLSELGD